MELLGVMLLLCSLYYLFCNEPKDATVQLIDQSPAHEETDPIEKTTIIDGHELVIPDPFLHWSLSEHVQYYQQLQSDKQIIFRQRLMQFLKSKIFLFHLSDQDPLVYVLIGAAAIQLTFGQRQFTLSGISLIQVFPREFLATHPVRWLVGHVHSRTISLSWTHVFNDYHAPFSIHHLVLHEMAHALQLQLQEEKQQHPNQNRAIDTFLLNARTIIQNEKKVPLGLYSSYGLRNEQEFWAESVELFFQLPGRLAVFYPQVYAQLASILLQDPLKQARHQGAVATQVRQKSA